MKSSTLLLVVICVTTVFLLAIFYNTAMQGIHTDGHAAGVTDIERMIRVIRIQNETIHTLTKNMGITAGIGSEANALTHIIEEKELQISLLREELQKVRSEQKSNDLHRQQLQTSHSHDKETLSSLDAHHQGRAGYALDVPPAALEAECDAYYGMQLVDKWRKAGQTWCTTDEGADVQSVLKCYPYTQHHKKTPDMFCDATNFVVDFSKVTYNPSLHACIGDMY